MSRPRRQYNFPTIQTSDSTDYIPSPTRDPSRRELFVRGNRGVVIAFQQKIGIIAAKRTFSEIVDSKEEDLIVDAAGLLATSSIGTAHHILTQHQSAEKMYVPIKLPRLFDAENDHLTTQAELIEKVQKGLAGTAKIATVIEEMTRSTRSTNLLPKMNMSLGRSLATIGVDLAVLNHKVAGSQLGEAELQDGAMRAAADAYQGVIDLTKKIGTRPTFAQYPDEGAPYRLHLSRDKESVSQPVYEQLIKEINTAEDEAFKAAE